ncbi:DUF3168 domain-containing protein [Rhizobium binxianense]
MSAANELLAAIHARLAGDQPLTDMIGPDGVRDRLVAGRRLPCIVVGEVITNDYSTSTEKGGEHFLALEIWAEAGGRKLVEEIAGIVRGLLDDAALALGEHELVSLQHRMTRSMREARTKLHVAEMRFRAVTEA